MILPESSIRTYVFNKILRVKCTTALPDRISFEGFERNAIGGDRLRRFAPLDMCSVEVEFQFVKRSSNVRAKKSVPSPYANAFGFAPAVA